MLKIRKVLENFDKPCNIRYSDGGNLLDSDVTFQGFSKGGLISESFFTLAQISKKMCQITTLSTIHEHYPRALST